MYFSSRLSFLPDILLDEAFQCEMGLFLLFLGGLETCILVWEKQDV